MKIGIVFVTLFLTTGCMDSMHESEKLNKTSFLSEGERLYFTGVSSSGVRIKPIGGHHHMQMHGGSCATCHGSDRQGGIRMWPRFWIVAPALTFEALAKEHNDGHLHASYDKASLKNAIVRGVKPNGDPLHETMPKWQMTNTSLEALVNFLLAKESDKQKGN